MNSLIHECLLYIWPAAFALKTLTAADEAKIGALLKKAVS
jgi:meiotically up-regulated gene 157 (Mug157) protein